MIKDIACSPSEWREKERIELRKILTQLADLEEQVAAQAKAAFLTNLKAHDLIIDQALALATELSLTVCATSGQGGADNPIIIRGLAKGLLLGLQEVGEDLYEGAYLTVRGMLTGAALVGADLHRVASMASPAILALAEGHGADRETVLKKMASGALDGDFATLAEIAAIEKLYLELFELIDHLH